MKKYHFRPEKENHISNDEDSNYHWLNVAYVPSGFPVRFCLLTHEGQQYVAYYDKIIRSVLFKNLTFHSTSI